MSPRLWNPLSYSSKKVVVVLDGVEGRIAHTIENVVEESWICRQLLVASIDIQHHFSTNHTIQRKAALFSTHFKHNQQSKSSNE